MGMILLTTCALVNVERTLHSVFVKFSDSHPQNYQPSRFSSFLRTQVACCRSNLHAVDLTWSWREHGCRKYGCIPRSAGNNLGEIPQQLGAANPLFQKFFRETTHFGTCPLQACYNFANSKFWFGSKKTINRKHIIIFLTALAGQSSQGQTPTRPRDKRDKMAILLWN